jgi:hypothetical protein
MSESPEVERSTQNPKGKTNIEQTPEPPLGKADPTEPVQVKGKISNPKQSPSGNLENAGQTDSTQSA